MKTFVIDLTSWTSKILGELPESAHVEANKVCFNSGWVMFYRSTSRPNGTTDELVKAFPVWRVIQVSEGQAA
jgi:hypothetical protein